MKLRLNRQLQTGLRIISLLTVILMPVFLSATPLFTFGVSNMEAYSRTGNWAWDADNSGIIFKVDSNPFTFNATSPHYYSEKYIHIGTTAGHVTSLTCTAENTDLAATPGQLSLTFSQFDLVSFTRINTVSNTRPWNTAGESGDERVYTNASGYLNYNGSPVLYMDKATFVITTPYPSQAQMRLLPGMSNWMGNVGTGSFQTGYGFGDIDITNPGTDPAWAALFASSNYKVDMILTNMVSTKDATTTWLTFNMDISPALVPSTTSSALVNINTLPANWDFPDQGTSVSVVGGTPDGSSDEMHHFYIQEILQTPAGTIPAGLTHQAKKYWKFGTSLTPASYTMNLTFQLSGAEFNKAPVDWKLLYRPFSDQNWVEWPNGYSLIDATHIQASNVSNVAEFTVASPLDETLPVTLTSFAANVNAQNLKIGR
ncbi:MAG: hypothetical protein RBS43_10785, partial [Candidatus Cloacimonas sp.]|nr:hypothetical protein [Candidatus Cloacimonas sp.]